MSYNQNVWAGFTRGPLYAVKIPTDHQPGPYDPDQWSVSPDPSQHGWGCLEDDGMPRAVAEKIARLWNDDLVLS